MGAPVRQGSHIVPRETGYVIRLGSAGEMADQRDHKQNQKDVENDFRDPRSSYCYPAKTQSLAKKYHRA